MTTSDDDYLNSTLQQRADYIPLDQLLEGTSNSGELFQRVHRELTNRVLRTIVGPRGCGKTHMMRYAWLKCKSTPTMPFAVYVSFNRYFRLEPLLSSNPGAIQQFHSWVLARILIALKDSIEEWGSDLANTGADFSEPEFSSQQLSGFVTRIERNQPLDEANLVLSDSLSIERIQRIIDEVRQRAGRKFSLLLMDDAALTLTPDYLIEFLDIVRSLKSATIAPKASVYPGTTEVSPKFHQGQDSIQIPVWISINDPQYDNIMQDIADKRIKKLDTIPSDAQAMLRFASFGIPRAYLTMLEEYQRSGLKFQQSVNKIIQEHLDARIAEFRSLGKKVPKFEQIIVAGEKVINGIAKGIKAFNEKLILRQEKGLTYGVTEDELTPIVERMFKLLVEAGLMFDDGSVKHGTPARIYRRFIPHTSLLLSIRAIDTGGAGGSIKQTLDAISLKTTKHPLRKSLSKMAIGVDLHSLDFSLPKCAHCDTRRLTDSQRFCHNCGHQLVDASTFNQCLDTEISSVPGLTMWQRTQIGIQLPNLRTIRDYLAKQDPAADLLTVRGFGIRKTTKIVDILNSYVDDYLS